MEATYTLRRTTPNGSVYQWANSNQWVAGNYPWDAPEYKNREFTDLNGLIAVVNELSATYPDNVFEIVGGAGTTYCECYRTDVRQYRALNKLQGLK